MKRLLIISVAGLFVLLTFSYFQQSEDNLILEVRRDPVVVSVERIPAGTTAQEARASGLLKAKELEDRFVPTGSVSEPGQLVGESTNDIAEGVVLTAEMFG